MEVLKCQLHINLTQKKVIIMDKKPLDTVTLSRADMEATMSALKGLQAEISALKAQPLERAPATSHALATEVSYAAKPSGEVADDTTE